MIRQLVGIVAFAVLAACSQVSVYDQPIPSAENAKSLLKIRDEIRPEDRDAWQAILMAKMNPMAQKIDAKTVGEAIQRFKARSACMEAHSTSKVPENTIPFSDPGYGAANEKHIKAYNAEVAAYNSCLKMPI